MPRYPTVPQNRVIREGDVGVGFTQQVLDAVRAAEDASVVGIKFETLWARLHAALPRWQWIRRATCRSRTLEVIGYLVRAGDVTTELLPGAPGRHSVVWVFPTERPDEDWPAPGDVHQRGGGWVWRNHPDQVRPDDG